MVQKLIKELIITGILVTLLLLPTINTINAATETPVFYAITQSSTTNLVEPILGNVPSDEFYDYWSSSGHTLYMEDQVSKIYLYKDDTGALSLIIHHSIDNSEEDYMRVDFDFEGVPEAAYVALSDDNSHFWGGLPNGREFDLSQNPEGSWEFYHNSDGGVLAGLPIDEPWTITITPNFVEGLTALGIPRSERYNSTRYARAINHKF